MAQMTEDLPAVEIPADAQENVRRVCFVCTGNTCRSPMAAAVANALAAKRGESPTLRAYSAGLYAHGGDLISPHAKEALELAGIEPVEGFDYHRHTAHTLTLEEAERYDLLIGLSSGHCMELMMRYPQLAQRIVGMPSSISDPFGGDLSVYRACLEEITVGVKQLLFPSDQNGTGGADA